MPKARCFLKWGFPLLFPCHKNYLWLKIAQNIQLGIDTFWNVNGYLDINQNKSNKAKIQKSLENQRIAKDKRKWTALEKWRAKIINTTRERSEKWKSNSFTFLSSNIHILNVIFQFRLGIFCIIYIFLNTCVCGVFPRVTRGQQTIKERWKEKRMFFGVWCATNQNTEIIITVC